VRDCEQAKVLIRLYKNKLDIPYLKTQAGVEGIREELERMLVGSKKTRIGTELRKSI
jgi:hypothetical protein